MNCYIKYVCILGSILLLISASAVLAATTVFNFEDLAGPLARMPDPYQGLIDWEDGSTWFHYDFAQSPYVPHSGTVYISSETADTTPSWRFTTPVIFEGAWFAGYPFASVTYYLFDSDGNLLHVSPIYSPSEVPTFFATGFLGAVSRVEIHTPHPGHWVLDDLTFVAPDEPPPPVFLPVAIDIKPGSDPNALNIYSEGVVPVAVLTTADFDAATVDVSTLIFEGAYANEKGKSGKFGSFSDVDSDGDLDLVIHFRTEELILSSTATEATIKGATFEGVHIKGTDTVKIVEN